MKIDKGKDIHINSTAMTLATQANKHSSRLFNLIFLFFSKITAKEFIIPPKNHSLIAYQLASCELSSYQKVASSNNKTVYDLLRNLIKPDGLNPSCHSPPLCQHSCRL